MTILTETKPAMQPPNKNNKTTAVGFPDDDVRKIGDQIGKLSKSKLKELFKYLLSLGIGLR